MAFDPITVINLTPVVASLGSSITSDAMFLQDIPALSIQVIWEGAIAGTSGTIFFDFSDDNINYAPFSAAGINITGASSSFIIAITVASFPYLKIRYTRTSGTTGTLTVIVNGRT